MKNKRYKEEGITLVALVVTVIMLLLLAGITIASLSGENGLFAKAKQAKEKYSISEAKEKIELAISELRIEQQGKAEELKKEDLSKINNDEIDVRDISNFPVDIICNNYKFEVDSNFNVSYVGEFNDTVITYTTEPEGYTNQDKVKILIKIKNSKGIKSVEYPNDDDKLLAMGQKEVGVDYDVTANGTYTFKVVDNDDKETLKDVVIYNIDKVEPKKVDVQCKPGVTTATVKLSAEDGDETESSSKSGIARYDIYVNGTKVGESTTDEYKITNLTKSSTYSMYVIAYDRAGNYKSSETITFTTTAGEYPTITANGINWPDEPLAEDAIGVEAFDNDDNTYCYYGKYDVYKRGVYAKIDKSLWGKMLNVKFNIWYGGSGGIFRTFTMYCYKNNDELIGTITSTGCSTTITYDYKFDIPEDCEKIKFIPSNPDSLDFRIYEIDIIENEELNNTTYRNLLPTMNSGTTIKNGVSISVSDYFLNGGEAYNGVDGNDNTAWSSNSGNYNEHWFKIQFLKPRVVKKYELTGMYSWGSVPSFYLQASNDNKNWINLENELHAGVFSYSPQTYSIEVDNTNAYKYYRIYIPAGAGWTYGSSGAGMIHELKMYGN